MNTIVTETELVAIIMKVLNVWSEKKQSEGINGPCLTEKKNGLVG